MKYFTQEALMNELCKHCDSHIEMCEDCPMKEMIKNVKSAWISCKERLPDGDENVLAYSSESGSIDMAYYNGNAWVQVDLYEILYLHPTHWMPLPDAPGVEDEQ